MAYNDQYESVLDYIEDQKGLPIRYLVVALMTLSMLGGMAAGFIMALLLII